jgi:hypothetical protein
MDRIVCPECTDFYFKDDLVCLCVCVPKYGVRVIEIIYRMIVFLL